MNAGGKKASDLNEFELFCWVFEFSFQNRSKFARGLFSAELAEKSLIIIIEEFPQIHLLFHLQSIQFSPFFN
jgi:hypothetical protein